MSQTWKRYSNTCFYFAWIFPHSLLQHKFRFDIFNGGKKYVNSIFFTEECAEINNLIVLHPEKFCFLNMAQFSACTFCRKTKFLNDDFNFSAFKNLQHSIIMHIYVNFITQLKGSGQFSTIYSTQWGKCSINKLQFYQFVCKVCPYFFQFPYNLKKWQ